MSTFYLFPEHSNKKGKTSSSGERLQEGGFNTKSRIFNDLKENENANFQSNFTNQGSSIRRFKSAETDKSFNSPSIMKYSNHSFKQNESKFSPIGGCQTSQIEIIGFSPDLVSNVFQEFMKFGQIEGYYYRNKCNWMILKYTTILDAYEAVNFYKNSIEGIKVNLNTENFELSPFNQSSSTSSNLNTNDEKNEDENTHKYIKVPSNSYIDNIFSWLFSW